MVTLCIFSSDVDSEIPGVIEDAKFDMNVLLVISIGTVPAIEKRIDCEKFS